MTDIFSSKQTAMWFAKAIDGAEQVQKLYPRDYHSAFTLGQAYHLLDTMSPARPVPARTDLSDRRTARPGELRHSRQNRFDGQTGKEEDMSKDAIKYYKKAIMLHPFKFELRNKLARLYAENCQYEDAIYELKEARSISPANQASYLNLAKVFINDREQYEEAENILLEFIKKNPDRKIIDIYRLLSYIYVKTTQWEKVLTQSKRITQIDRKDLEAHKYATMANFKLERYDDARKLCNRILKLTGQTNNTYNKYAKEMLKLLSEK